MSYKRPFISESFVRRNGLEAGEKLLYIVLRSYQDQNTGHCTPTHDQLTWACAVSDSTIRAWLDSLESKGFIQRHRTPNRCAYTFLPPQISRGKLPPR